MSPYNVHKQKEFSVQICLKESLVTCLIELGFSLHSLQSVTG